MSLDGISHSVWLVGFVRCGEYFGFEVLVGFDAGHLFGGHCLGTAFTSEDVRREVVACSHLDFPYLFTFI